MLDVVIVGAGISGLAAAYSLRDVDGMQILEAGPQPGGVIRSERVEGYLLEHGPNTIHRYPAPMQQVMEEIGLADSRIPLSSEGQKRFVVRNGRPEPIFTNPWSFLTSPLISWRGKLRLLTEPFQPQGDQASESVASFVERRLGKEAVDYLIDPFVAGVFAGDPRRLSVEHAFPTLPEMERNHGSLTSGLIRRALGSGGSSSKKRGSYSFQEGLQRLPEGLADAVEGHLQLESPVQMVRRRSDRWEISYTLSGAPQTIASQSVILAVPLHRIPALLSLDEASVDAFETVSYPPLSVIHLGYRRQEVGHALDGFGLLVPRRENLTILGTLFSSSMFRDRAPAGHALLTSFVGGMRNPNLAKEHTDVLIERVDSDNRQLLDIHGPPVFSNHTFWPRAIPQYHVGYEDILDTLRQIEDARNGLFFAGNYRNGIAVPDAFSSGRRAARRVRNRL